MTTLIKALVDLGRRYLRPRAEGRNQPSPSSMNSEPSTTTRSNMDFQMPDIMWNHEAQRPFEQTLQEHRDLFEEQFKLLHQQHQLNTSFDNRIAENERNIDTLNQNLNKMHKKMKRIKKNLKRAKLERSQQRPQRDPRNSNANSSTQRTQSNASIASSADSTNNVIHPGENLRTHQTPAGPGTFGTRCVYCNENTSSLVEHIRYFCLLAPDQLNGRRRPCQFCTKFFARNYLKTHERAHCRSRNHNNSGN